jgi:hypothetical protein
LFHNFYNEQLKIFLALVFPLSGGFPMLAVVDYLIEVTVIAASVEEYVKELL